MTTLREKRHRQCLITIARLLDQREQAFARLAIISQKLRHERQRLAYYEKPSIRLAREIQKDEPEFTPLPKAPAWVPIPSARLREQLLDGEPDLSIPEFLKRGPTPKDVEARAEIEAAQAERKAVKTKARIAKLKAQQAGETRRMPLTGRDALKRIREG